MSFLNKIIQKLSVMQWSIGFANGNIADVIRNKALPANFTWLPLSHKLQFIADPFIFLNKQGNINLLYEDFSIEKDGFIALKKIDQSFRPLSEKTILSTNSHLSYPLVFEEKGTTYIIPESHQQNKLSCFEYDFDTDSLKNERILIHNERLLDATILVHNNKYWLFATKGDGEFDNSKMYLYHADSLFGNYLPHPKNPVKHHLDGTRPAGNFIRVDGAIYRPSQNCGEYYGKSITIQKIIKLNELEYAEEHYCSLDPAVNSPFNAGLHTINAVDNIIVIDGIKLMFMPWTKTKLFLKKLFNKPT